MMKLKRNDEFYVQKDKKIEKIEKENEKFS